MKGPMRLKLYEAQVLDGKIVEVGKDCGQVGSRHAKPRRQRGAVLIQRRAGQPSAVAAGVVRAGKRQSRKGSVHVPAFHRSAHDQLVVAPCVVAATVGVVLQRAPESGERERCDGSGDAKFLRRGVKGVHSLAYLNQQVRLGAGQRALTAVSIESSLRAEEDLAFQAQGCPGLDDLGYLLELPSQTCGGKSRGQCGKSIQGAAEQLAIEESPGRDLAIGLNQGYAGV